MPADHTEGTSEAGMGISLPPPLAIPGAAASALRFQLGLSFCAFILIGANDAALGILLPSFQAFYDIDKSAVGLMFAASVSGYLLSAFGSGLLVERLGMRAYMLLGCASFAFGALLFGMALPFPVLVTGAIFVGFGIAVIDAGLNAYIAGLPNSTAALNYLHAFFGIGALLGPLLATGVLELGWAWYWIYYLWVAFALLLFVGFAFAFKAARTARSTREEGGGNVMRAMLRLRVVWVAAAFLFVYVGLEVSLGIWAYSFLVEERRDPTGFSGVAVSGYWLGLTVGRLVMGRLGAKLGNMRLIRLCLAGTVAGITLVMLLPFPPLEAQGLWLVGFSLGPIFPTTISLMSGIVQARLLPGVVGFLAGLGAMGAAIFPAAAGALAQLLGLWSLLPFEIALTLLMVALWLRLQGPGIRGLRG
jgi:fucose permease